MIFFNSAGAVFAVSREAVLAPRRAVSSGGPEPATAFYERLLRATRLGGDGAAPDPVARSQAFERLWRYVFVDAAGG